MHLLLFLLLLLFGLASSEDYENLHCELIMFLLVIMLALVTMFFLGVLEFVEFQDKSNSFAGLLFYS